MDATADAETLQQAIDERSSGRARAAFVRAAPRVALLVLAAMVLYGSWAAYANLGHGAAAALRAGLTQGASSGTTTLVIGTILETVHATLPPRRHRALLATIVAASITALMHVGLHVATGTPEILRAVLPSVVMGYVFAGAYARSLEGSALRVVYRRAATLTAAERDSIWALLARSVQRDRAAFEEKLGRTGEVFLGRSRAGALVAFGAVDVIEADAGEGTETLIYTNWAVIDPRFRGTNIIQRVGFRFFLRERLRHPRRTIHWLFTASTYQSYLLPVRNFVTFWPRAGVETPPRVLALLDTVMRRTEGDAWDAEAGVLRRHGVSRYREGVVDDEPESLKHPELGPTVRFYHERNSGQCDGDSLACLCPLTAENWWSCLRAAVARARRPRRAK